MTQQQLGVDVRQQSWDAGDVKLWQSSTPGIFLVESKTIRLAHSPDSNRFLAGLTQFRRWVAGNPEILGGTAFMSLAFEPVLDDSALQAGWRRLLAQNG